jgi:YfiH family protein
VHGADVRVVTRPGEWAGSEGDALVTASPQCALAVQVADCAPIAMVGDAAVGVVHAGWRGLAAGVIEAAFTALGELDRGEVFAVLGPHIGPECYEFGPDQLDELARRFGPGVRGRTSSGTPAFDLGAAVRSELGRLGVRRIIEVGECTSCLPDRYYSHRARGEPGRHAMVAWLETSS